MSELLDKLGRSMLLSQSELATLIRSAPHRYKVYEIPKRAPGQFRTIAQPAREVKALQYWVMANVLKQFDIHPAATAYRSGMSIADNARPHRRANYLLKLDFKDFFPSLKSRDFRRFLDRKDPNRFDPDDVYALCQILFWMNKTVPELCLSIGAPTSPMLSNILMFDFDQRVASICQRNHVSYTRYADDLSFSARDSVSLGSVEKGVFELCGQMKSPSLTINAKKTVRVSKRDARRVTGLVLTNDQKVSIGRIEKRRIRAWVHHFVMNRLDSLQIVKLQGMLAFINSVEPSFLRRLQNRYGADVIQRCLDWRPEA